MMCNILFSIKKKIFKMSSAEFFTQHAKVLKYRKHFLGDLLLTAYNSRYEYCFLSNGITSYTTI